MPNITGTFPTLNQKVFKGAFKSEEDEWWRTNWEDGLLFSATIFDASRCSKLYRNNFNKVQPASIRVNFWHRIS